MVLITPQKRSKTYITFLLVLSLIIVSFAVADYYLVEWIKVRVGVEGIQPYHIGIFMILYSGVTISITLLYLLLTKEPVGSILIFFSSIIMILFLWEDLTYYAIAKMHLGAEYSQWTWLWFQQIIPTPITTITVIAIAITGLITITLVALIYTRKARHLSTI